MKKTVIILVIILFIANNNYSQERPVNRERAGENPGNVQPPSKNKNDRDMRFLKIGLEVAPGLAWIKGVSNNVKSSGSRIGFGYGLMTEFYFTQNYGFLTGINVVYGGGKLDRQDTIKSNTYKLKYIEIPLTLKMRTKEYGYLSYYAKFGVGAGFNIKAKKDFKYGDNVVITPKSGSDIDAGDDIKLFRGSFIIGLGAEYSLTGTTKAVVGISFDNGLTNVMKKKGDKAINNLINIDLGILF